MTTHLLLGAALLLGAFTPAKVSDVTANPSAQPDHQPPRIIFVESFSMDQAAAQAATGESDSSEGGGGGRPHLFGMFRGGEQNTFLGHRKEEQYDETLQKLPGILRKALISNLQESIAPARNGDGVDLDVSHSWVITGQFLVVNPGNRAMQAGVGFGAGQSQVQIQAQVYTTRDLNRPFLVFGSKGASGHMPGAVVMMNPYVAAAKFVMSKKEPEKEAKKIAKSIAQEIGKFMTAQGIPTLASQQGGGSSSSQGTPDESSK